MSEPIKIYRFPYDQGFRDEWMVLGKYRSFVGVLFGYVDSLKDCLTRNPRFSIDDYLDQKCGQLALDCWKGEYEQYCVWVYDQEIKQPQVFDFTNDYSLDRFDLILKD